MSLGNPDRRTVYRTHRPLGLMNFSSATGDHWPAALQPLLHWLANRSPQPGLTLFTLPHLLPADLLQHLHANSCLTKATPP